MQKTFSPERHMGYGHFALHAWPLSEPGSRRIAGSAILQASQLLQRLRRLRNLFRYNLDTLIFIVLPKIRSISSFDSRTLPVQPLHSLLRNLHLPLSAKSPSSKPGNPDRPMLVPVLFYPLRFIHPGLDQTISSTVTDFGGNTT
jgi:hypothetical protein